MLRGQQGRGGGVNFSGKNLIQSERSYFTKNNRGRIKKKNYIEKLSMDLNYKTHGT